MAWRLRDVLFPRAMLWLGSSKRAPSHFASAVITGPQWKGVLPAGVKQIKSGTNMVWLVGRTYSSGTAQDYDAVHAMQDQYTLVPLALFGKPTPTPEKGVDDSNIDMTTPPRDQIDKLDAAEFFKRLALLMKSNPPTPQDAPMVAILARLGVAGDFEVSKLPRRVSQGLSRVPETARKKIFWALRHPETSEWVDGVHWFGSLRYGLFAAGARCVHRRWREFARRCVLPAIKDVLSRKL